MGEPAKASNTPNGVYPPGIQRFQHSSYFWGLPDSPEVHIQQVDPGNESVRRIFPDYSPKTWAAVLDTAIECLNKVYGQIEHPASDSEEKYVTEVVLSQELAAWREEQHQAGRKLRSKGQGLARISDTVSGILNVGDWSPCLLASSAFYGCFFANMLIGAHDPYLLYSNYCTDMGFFIEHGYHHVFPEFSSILHAEIASPRARETRGGNERRDITALGLIYTRYKVALEEKHAKSLTNKTARVSRDELLAVMLCESGILGMAAEGMVRGFDSTAVAFQFIMSSPGTDMVDVGFDIVNSELFNSLLNTADITESGVITEEALRNVYDAYAHCMTRMFTSQWNHPGSRMCAVLMSWHIQNDRHHYLRRALLGYPKARKGIVDQRIADIEEAFDEHMHTTGFSRPLENACNGKMVCDQVQQLFDRTHGEPMLKDIWYHFAEGAVDYISKGVVDERREDDLVEGSRVAMARAASYGLTEDLTWLMCHAGLHALQVNCLAEAAMFGSLLDDGGLKGKLDRKEEGQRN